MIKKLSSMEQRKSSMKSTYLQRFAILLNAIGSSATIACFMFASLSLTLIQTQADEVPRGIINIVFDDADLYDFGFNNQLLPSPDIQTPVLDYMKSQGRYFPNYRCASAICSPSRAAMLTGLMPVRLGAIDSWPQRSKIITSIPSLGGLPSEIPQLGRTMQAIGRRTGHFGKWHVGFDRERFRPSALGFDEYTLHIESSEVSRSGVFQFLTEHGAQYIDVDFLDTEYANRVIDFVRRADDDDVPFFLNYWPLSPHKPIDVPRDFDNNLTNFDLSTERGRLCAMIYQVDEEIGRIMSVLDERDLLSNTLIVVSSDNAAPLDVRHPQSNLKGSKATLYEGGITVPLIAFWPDQIPAGTTNSSSIMTYDLLPTFLNVSGYDTTELESLIDGRSKTQAFVSNVTLNHDPVFWEVAGSSYRTSDVRADRHFAYRSGPYKLVKVRGLNDATNPSAYSLFNVDWDPTESQKLNASQPTLLARMKREMLALRKQACQMMEFPLSNNRSKITIPWDPRFDVRNSDATFETRVNVSSTLSRDLSIYDHPGAQSIKLKTNRTVQWTLHASQLNKTLTNVVMTTPPLTPGRHSLHFRINGFKLDGLEASIVVDGNQAATLPAQYAANLRGLQPTESSVNFGDTGLTLDSSAYYCGYFYLDELP
jgi:arylsulfatase A-like enzyme